MLIRNLFVSCFTSLALLSLGLSIQLNGQDTLSAQFVFYNVENLFDISDDSLSLDDEFTPDGDKRWTGNRYYHKLDGIAKTLTSLGGWELPAVIGLCEIENYKVLDDLRKHRLLASYGYEIIHKDSPDRRGIDVAMLYKAGIFDPLLSNWIEIRFPWDTNFVTRDILYVKAVMFRSDTIHMFINHWPSRWEGVEVSRPNRLAVARQLRIVVDSLFKAEIHPNIIIAGDLNDTPTDSSVFSVLGAISTTSTDIKCLYNLMYPFHKLGQGTLKYQGNWDVFDQIIVSGHLLNGAGIKVRNNEAYIFNEKFLLISAILERNLLGHIQDRLTKVVLATICQYTYYYKSL